MNEDFVSLDLYEILNVSPDASMAKIKKKYKKLILKFHPDKPTGDVEAFELINSAYQILKKYRNEYDSKRRMYLYENTTFDSLKTTFDSLQTFKDDDILIQAAKLKFTEIDAIMNDKHGFNVKDTNPISSSLMSSRLNDLQNNRVHFDVETKKNTKKLNVTNYIFNDMYVTQHIPENKKDQDIIAYNELENQSITYSNINNNEMTSNENNQIDEVFNQQLPLGISNNYDSHNIISNNDNLTIDEKMKQYNNLSSKYSNMKLQDFNTK